MNALKFRETGWGKAGGLLLLLLALTAGCTSTTVDEFRQGDTGIESHESVVILGRRQAGNRETSSDFVECVGDRLAQGMDGLSVVPEQEFLDAMFPWFEPRTAPLQPEHLGRLMVEEQVALTMRDFGVRYIIWVDGFTETLNRVGSISCTVAPGGAGCFGYGSWEDDASFNAEIWDVENYNGVGQISTDATGQSFMPAIVIPIPLIARVEANACQRLGDQLKSFVIGG